MILGERILSYCFLFPCIDFSELSSSFVKILQKPSQKLDSFHTALYQQSKVWIAIQVRILKFLILTLAEFSTVLLHLQLQQLPIPSAGKSSGRLFEFPAGQSQPMLRQKRQSGKTCKLCCK